MSTPGSPFAAIVLAGGRGERLGGAVKATLQQDAGGPTLLERALAAVTGATAVVVVGDPVPLPGHEGPQPRWAREDPPLGGPAAALLAGVDALAPRLTEAGDPATDTTATGTDTTATRDTLDGWLVVLAVDMPHLDAGTVARLLTAAEVAAARGSGDGARLRDPDGRHPLALAVSARRLADVRPAPGEADGLPLRRLLAPLDLADVPTVGDEHRDVDTPDDLAAWRAR
ncbi:NTP transferase domain-containing protein [Nocardioides sp. GY 10127]|uniref:molybdenum cofactor guanylyltransferase n=1 Tax=Nocardioides sp. GY 10127 TaxID=2569762 RepID=UPI001F101817|nr:NTP transferase domain-containing protein [Nocardioides sp. GY 10127]